VARNSAGILKVISKGPAFERIAMLDRTVCIPLLTRSEVDAAIKRIALEIDRDYQGKNLLVIGVLKGSFIFLADLVRNLNLALQIDFVRVSSYGRGRETSGKVRILLGPSCAVEGRDVLVVEDIIDTGLSAAHFMHYLKKRHPASLKLCALVSKPSRRRVDVAIDYLGFTVPDRFLVGCGLDWDEKYRHLPDICALEEGNLEAPKS
jgi:hypoxanthine phosphoribosyltransferase